MSLDGVNKLSLVNAGAEAGKEVAENGSFMVKTGAEAAKDIMKGGIFATNIGMDSLMNGALLTKIGAESIMNGTPLVNAGALIGDKIVNVSDAADALMAKPGIKTPVKGGIYYTKDSLIAQLRAMRDRIDKILEKIKKPEVLTTETKGKTIEELYKEGKPGMILAHYPTDGGIVDSTPHEIPPYSDGGIVGKPVELPEGPLGGRIVFDL